MAALLVGAIVWGTSTDPRTRPGIEPPFDLIPVEGLDRLGAPVTVPARGDRVLLYVSETCTACARELTAWEVGLRAREGPPPRLIVAPGTAPGEASWIPPTLRDARVHDVRGRIAGALGVRAVPFVAVLDDDGWVVEARVGVSSRDTLARLLAFLRAAPEGGS